ncbi:MAG TPA: phosphoglucosamine mutase [Alphaproteobacteria bacterium]|nr:phosphoglucosamine mutase [Alphaproteobacteria bacterium]HCS23108.1 phosphoglucosamine mutase [Rhodospirillaceae bacterium]HRJ67009.1 phosphoglucosamine mutase [Alphaproteobacteria bacterium]
MTRKLFGTDGIRGKANTGAITAETALKVAMAAAQVLARGSHRRKVVIGKDTRLSGYMLEPAMQAGFISMGLDVVLVGPMPTPAVAMLTRSLRADLGVVISASHNLYEDNGIKLFGADGYKLTDETEAEIEALLATDLSTRLVPAPQLGRAARLEDASGRYIEYVKNTFPKGLRLDGLKIVVDCANGAAYKVAPRILYELGADVVPIAITPDGTNINKHCGATAPDLLCEHVVKHGAHLGIALDGDADRLILCDEHGHVVDGDQIMALIASAMHARGELEGGGVTATVMSNLGLERHLKSKGLQLFRTPVGDRYVVDHMRQSGCNIGGEQSGHIILGDYSTTGDGLIAALQVLAVIRTSGRAVSEICRVFAPVPQLLQNVRTQSPVALDAASMREAIRAAEGKLGDSGRILIRKSGTEPLVRVMAEGDDAALVKAVVQDLCAAVEKLDTPAAKAG